MHETGIHGGPPTKVVGAVVIAAFVFGTTVLITDGLGGDAMTENEAGSTMAVPREDANGGGGGP